MFILAYYSFAKAPESLYQTYSSMSKGHAQKCFLMKDYLLSDSDDLAGADLFILFSIKKKKLNKITFLGITAPF